jgi:chromosome segregation ATPase
MKNMKTYNEFINEADAKTALKTLGDNEKNKQDVNQDRQLPQTEKDRQFQDKTKKQALTKTTELEQAAKNIDTNQQKANKRMEDIKLKQDLLPDDPTNRKQFLKDTESDLKDVEKDLDNSQQQRKSLQKQQDRIKTNFIKK